VNSDFNYVLNTINNINRLHTKISVMKNMFMGEGSGRKHRYIVQGYLASSVVVYKDCVNDAHCSIMIVSVLS